MTKSEICSLCLDTAEMCRQMAENSADVCNLTDYKEFVFKNNFGEDVWSEAICRALAEHSVLHIPSSPVPYFIDRTVILPSNRKISAGREAVIKRASGFNCVMLRNEHNADGSAKNETSLLRDKNISVTGGVWDGNCEKYRRTPYDENGSFSGVSACIFINHCDCIFVKDVTVINSGEFAIQIGDISNAVFENVTFDSCHADGLHIGGKSSRIFAKNISGDVGDDLVALNAYDWKRSSVNFGAISSVFCENLVLAPQSKYKALRILPGKYFYGDGGTSDCTVSDVVIKDVRGINTFKLYFQREAHIFSEHRGCGALGYADNIYFEDIEAFLAEPIDALAPYLESNPSNGHFSVFEFGAEIGNIEIENVRACIDKQRYPMSYFVQVGAKSVRDGNIEYFDPEIGGTVKNLTIKNSAVNSKAFTSENASQYICEIVFDNIYGDGISSSHGKIEKIKII